MRIGHGYDVHRLVEGRRCIICGVDVPSKLGLDGHSDADVAVHALMDAMLGAAALGDIGRHFPDTDPAFKGIDSLILLDRVAESVRKAGYELSNADITIIAQTPKLSPYMAEMVSTLSSRLGVSSSQINVKATTEERLGFTGAREGIAAHAVVLLKEIE